MDDEQFYVYVLQNAEGRLYIGFTTGLDERVVRHNTGRSKWTRSHGPWKLVYHERYGSRAEALGRERYLKQGKANQELRRLIAEINGRVAPSAEG